MEETLVLIDRYIKKATGKHYIPEIIEITILKAKIMIIAGKIGEALTFLEDIKDIALDHQFFRLEDKIGQEILQITQEFEKIDDSVKQRIEKVRLAEYFKEAQKIVRIQ